jgi:hypothetical protein
VQVKTSSCFVLLTTSLACCFLNACQIICIQNGISTIKIENVAPPNSMKTADASEHLIAAHKSDHPSFAAAGGWRVNRTGADRALQRISSASCWDTSSTPKKNQKGNRPRHDALQKNHMANSPGTLNASDPHVWASEDPAC